ncbi:MAG: type IV secretion system DNA-binding domain-containing protein [Clostridia bacterium]|nr:type IV secretion system DNA-binding domain-containing protein [Clostridia bacterium]
MAEVIHGKKIERIRPREIEEPIVRIPGKHDGTPAFVDLNKSILSKHLMLIGGTGCGKTNTFFHIVDQVQKQMTDDDVMIIFDTKGDYLKQKDFYNPEKDYIISASKDYEDVSVKWNIFKELLIDGYDDAREWEANANEIAWGLFSEAIERNSSNPFFPNAARDLFASLLIWRIRRTQGKQNLIETFLDNRMLRNMLDRLTPQSVYNKLSMYPDQQAVLNYIGDGKNTQGLGVFAELQSITRQVFVGGFAEPGDFSMREFVRNKGGRKLFIEYDLVRGRILTPIYKLLVDLALKESMGRQKSVLGDKVNKDAYGNVYVFCDEFKLLPSLQHIEDAVNFGRALGVKVIAGLQSINQLYENYGVPRGKNIAAGFSSVFSFRMNDADSRNFTVGLYGGNYVIEDFKGYDREKRSGNVVEDWDMTALEPGQAIIGLADNPPFKFKFDLFKGEYNG